MNLKNNDWQEFFGTEEEWDGYCLKFNGNYRCLYSWGKYQEEQGWKVKRFLYKKGEDNFAVQILFRRKYFFNAIYVPGGILGNQSGFCKHFKSLISEEFKNNINYVRLDSSYEYNEESNKKFLDDHWKRPPKKLNSRQMISLNLENRSTELFPGASRDFKKNIKKSYKKNNYYESGFAFSDKEVEETSEAMQKFKQTYLRDDPKNIIKIINFLKERIIFISSRDEAGKMIGFRCAFVFRGVAWDFYAATTIEGRKKSTGFLLLSELVKECVSLGISNYLLPISISNHGDTAFKKGTGGNLEKYMGEYEYSNFFIMSYIVNFIIYLRFNYSSLKFLYKTK